MPMREVDGILLKGAKFQTFDGASVYPFDFFFGGFVGKRVQVRVTEVEK